MPATLQHSPANGTMPSGELYTTWRKHTGPTAFCWGWFPFIIINCVMRQARIAMSGGWNTISLTVTTTSALPIESQWPWTLKVNPY